MTKIEMPSSTETAMLMLLGQRFGDGLVYLCDRDDELLRNEAIRLGLVAEDGYVTAGGKKFWQANA
jgi:AmiR/NasT family two-component response regulator